MTCGSWWRPLLWMSRPPTRLTTVELLVEMSFLVTAPVMAPPRREPPVPAHPRVSGKGGKTHVPGAPAAGIRMRKLYVLDILEAAGVGMVEVILLILIFIKV